MNLVEYLKSKIIVILINMVGVFLISLFISVLGVSISAVLIINSSWIFVLLLIFTLDFYSKKKRYSNWMNIIEKLDKKYLFTEVIDKPSDYIEYFYYKLLKMSSKSMIEEINTYKNKEKDYEEYIEKWVHEMKTPISAISLLCDNNKNELTKKIKKELNKINNLVEETLFYARSEIVHKDYFISEVIFNEVIHTIIIENKLLLQEKKISLLIDEELPIVRSDKKWLIYIINQIFINSIKYSKEKDSYIKIKGYKENNSTYLHIEDNGRGITSADLPRVFEKGFTGSNRNKSHSTGMGLYLCKKLCDKLKIDIKVNSHENEFTRVTLVFNENNYLNL